MSAPSRVDVLAAQVRERIRKDVEWYETFGDEHATVVQTLRDADAALDALVGCVTAAEERAAEAWRTEHRRDTDLRRTLIKLHHAEAALADAERERDGARLALESNAPLILDLTDALADARNALARIAAAGEGVPDWRSMADLAREVLARLDGGQE